MITPDAVANLIRLLRTTTAPLSVQPTEQLRPVLPELNPGERVSAYVLTEQPNGRFHVLIKDSLLDLNLPRNTQPGQTLELVVEKAGNRPVFSLPPVIPEPDAPEVSFSESVKVLKQALPQVPSGAPARIVASQPLVESPVQTPQMAAALQQTIEDSGLFYEAHQQQWILGQRTLEALRQEPQAQWPPLVAKPEVMAAEAPLANMALEELPESLQALARLIRDLPAPAGHNPTTSPTDNATAKLASLLGQAVGVAAEAEVQAKPNKSISQYETQVAVSSMATESAEEPPTSNPLPTASLKPQELMAELGKVLTRPEVQNLVQQQMQAMDQHLVWQGPVWPGQEMRWEVIGEREGDAAPDAPPTAWSTRLSLQLPVLGEVKALLQLANGQFMLRFAAQDPETVSALRQGQLRLETQFAGAGLELGGATVEAGAGDE